MKKHLSRILALVLVVLLLLPATAQAVGAGTQVRQWGLYASDTLRYDNIVSNNAQGRQEAHYLIFTPDYDIRPIVSAGAQIAGASNINAVIGHAQNQGHNVLGGINSDFFSFQTGIMEGIYISAGQLRSSHHGRSAIFFRDNGSAFIANPTLNFTLTSEGGHQVSAPSFNKARQPGWLFLYDEHFADTTRTTTPGREVLFRITNGAIRVGGAVSLEVASISNSSGATAIPAGHLILSADQNSPQAYRLNGFSAGDNVTLRVTSSDPRVMEATWATGGGDILVSGGQRTSGWDPGVGGVHPRSAFGIRADGSIILYAVDGRIPGHSAGLTLTELADEMMRLGARYVVNLDGGGSTTFSYRIPGTENAAVRNRPSAGNLRNCATFILLTSRYHRDSQPAHLQFHPGYDVLAGSLLTAERFPGPITMTDRGYFPLSTAGLRFTHFEASATLGTGQGNGFRTAAGSNAFGLFTVHAENGAWGRAHLNLVARPEQIDVRLAGSNTTNLTLASGDVVHLTSHALAHGRELFVSPDMWSRSVTDGLATLDANGRLTAGGAPGTHGQITISAGGMSRTVNLTIARHFADTNGHWAEDYIGQMRAASVARGAVTDQGTLFRPNQNISRAEFAAMLTRLLGINPAGYNLAGHEFLDHNQIPAWARPYVAAMFQRGYITGRAAEGGVRFDAISNITRTEAFVILGRLLDTNAPDSALHRFSDHEQIPNWARPEIARLAAAGLLTGTADGRLLPLNNITRAEAATILARIAPNILNAHVAEDILMDDNLFEYPEYEEQTSSEDEPSLPESETGPDLDPGVGEEEDNITD